jgi:excisionase family DNA binding protein
MPSSDNRLYSAKEATAYLGISLSTLGRIESQGLLIPFRTPGGHRRYAKEMLDDYLETTRVQHNSLRGISVVSEGGN